MDTRSIRSLVSLFVLFVALRSGALDADGRDKSGSECLSPAKYGPWVTSPHSSYVTKVGIYFSDGDCGYPRDASRAVEAWTRALILDRTENDTESAAFNASLIARCYLNGPCPKNLVEVYAWLNLSLVFQEKPAARDFRNSLERQLSASAVEQAQARTQEIIDILDEASVSRVPEEKKPFFPEPAFGTAFFVSSEGHAVTNHHVIEGCRVLRIGNETATVVARDERADLAVLRAGPRRRSFATFRDGGGVTAGTSVIVIGYPLPGLLSSVDPNVTTGVVSALAGPAENRRYFQVTAPIQPGNSGGPLLDSSGHVIGVVVSTLSTVDVANATGAIPQNLNFAIKAPAVRAMLESNEIPFQTAKSAQKLEVSDVAARARRYTEQVECTK